MKKKLSDWSKEVKIAMIRQDLDTKDVAERMKWSTQYTSSIINGRAYQRDSVNRISQMFDIEIPSHNATLAKNK